jgi:betaine reductase
MAKELEREGIPTALLCNIVPIALTVGANRVVPTRGIQYPTGDPSLPREQEEAWRERLLLTALKALQTPVDGPTVFPSEERGEGGR